MSAVLMCLLLARLHRPSAASKLQESLYQFKGYVEWQTYEM